MLFSFLKLCRKCGQSFSLFYQVGLAFLAGLGFVLLLVPVNRYLAIKIQQLSKEMMAQKDGRVKV